MDGSGPGVLALEGNWNANCGAEEIDLKDQNVT